MKLTILIVALWSIVDFSVWHFQADKPSSAACATVEVLGR